MKGFNKKGISAVVATVLLILISVAAIGIVWVAILSLASDLDFDNIEPNVEVIISKGYTVCDKDNNIFLVQLKRGDDTETVNNVVLGAKINGNTERLIVSAPKPNSFITHAINVSSYSECFNEVSASPLFIKGNGFVEEGSITSKVNVPHKPIANLPDPLDVLNPEDLGEGGSGPSAEVCGDLICNGAEVCGVDDSSPSCNTDCGTCAPGPSCGDGNIDAGETCDDSNTVSGDGCSNVCQVEVAPVCGDGTIDLGEQCDDGNLINGDGCGFTCYDEILSLNAIDWTSTEAGNSLVENPSLFTFDGTIITTTSTDTNIHSHYTVIGSTSFSNYTYSGLMRTSDITSGNGITFYSGYTSVASYYRLRFHEGDVIYHFVSAGTSAPKTYTGTTVVVDTWFKFKARVINETTQTRIQTKIWINGTGEPSPWDTDVVDTDVNRFTSGTLGIWGMDTDSNSDTKEWRELKLVFNA